MTFDSLINELIMAVIGAAGIGFTVGYMVGRFHQPKQ